MSSVFTENDPGVLPSFFTVHVVSVSDPFNSSALVTVGLTMSALVTVGFVTVGFVTVGFVTVGLATTTFSKSAGRVRRPTVRTERSRAPCSSRPPGSSRFCERSAEATSLVERP